jgi:micrococcal nuclease
MSVARLAVVVGLGALAGVPGCSALPSCGPGQAVVDRVIDGDTIVAGGVTLRYLLVDAPEATDGHTECFGDNAARFNADLVLGKTVEIDHDVACQDRFGRTLAYVTVGGQDINRLLIERGYACVLHIPPDGDDRVADFLAAQAVARAARLGLWGACDPLPCQAGR